MSVMVLSFIGGLVAIWIVVASPLAHLHHHYLVAHMLQHLILSLCAAPLILLGGPAMPFVRRLRIPFQIDPAICWGAAMLVFVGWHLPFFFDLAWRSEGWHLIEAATFFISGLLFWWPVIQPWPDTATWPRGSLALYLFLATLPCDVLSAFLAFSDRLVYPAYALVARHGSMTALQDQVGAGALMWLSVTFAYGVPASIIMLKELSPQRQRQPGHQQDGLNSAAEV